MSATLGIDIGGANIKVAANDGAARSVPFQLWRTPERLRAALQEILNSFPSCGHVGVTMTGELADCFDTKREGVLHILDAIEGQYPAAQLGVYLVGNEWASLDEARDQWQRAAASNWHALAQYAARYLTTVSGVLLDIGSTSTDIVPLEKTGPVECGDTDPERLLDGSLLYTGVMRSPVCAVVQQVPFRDAVCSVAQELFACTGDAYLLLDDLREDPDCVATADGRPFTKPFASARLARMVCADQSEAEESDVLAIAESIRRQHVKMISDALQRVVERAEATCLLVSGQGEFLARYLPAAVPLPQRSLGNLLGRDRSECAPAYAVAVLLQEALVRRAT